MEKKRNTINGGTIMDCYNLYEEGKKGRGEKGIQGRKRGGISML